MLGKADTTVDMQIKNTVSNYTFQGLLKRQKIDLNRVSGKSLIFCYVAVSWYVVFINSF